MFLTERVGSPQLPSPVVFGHKGSFGFTETTFNFYNCLFENNSVLWNIESNENFFFQEKDIALYFIFGMNQACIQAKYNLLLIYLYFCISTVCAEDLCHLS